MSFTSEAFAAARHDMATYHPHEATLPATGFKPIARSAPFARAARVELPQGPLLNASADVRAGRLSCVGLLERALEAVVRWGDVTAAVVTLLEDRARRDAKALDQELSQGQWRGPLHGMPITVKDNIDVAGAPTRAGSAAYNRLPEADAEAVRQLRRAGALILAKVATHEFALGVTTPQARHPMDASRIPGGSSGGSAISVATGMALGSLGTDTRASIRVPASLCGVVGFKPTYGALPVSGIVWLSWSMDHIGALAGSIGDAASVVSAISPSLAGLLQDAPRVVTGWRVGVPEAGFVGASDDVARTVRATLQMLADAGVDLVPTVVPSDEDFRLANAAGLIISRAEALAYHRSLGTDIERVWPETADQLRVAEDLSATEYLDAQRFRRDLQDRLGAPMNELDLAALCMPTTLVTAPLRSEAESFFTLLSRNAIPWSLIGWPAVSLPCPVPAGRLPIGLQIVAPPFEDASLVSLGAAISASGNAPNGVLQGADGDIQA